MIILERARENRIEAGDERTEEAACRRTDQAASAGAACSKGSSSSARTHLRPDATHAAPWGVLYHTEVCTKDLSASFRTQNVGVGNVQVIARDGDVEVVFKCERDGVIQRQIQFAVVHKRVDPRGVR